MMNTSKSLTRSPLKITGLTILLLMTDASLASDFPSACQMSVEERQKRTEVSHMERIQKYMLSDMPSVIDDCAFGERLKSAFSGLLANIFGRIPSFDSMSGDFFCGFGAMDAWELGTVVANQEGRRDYATWWNQSRSNALNEAKGVSRLIPGQIQLEDPDREGINENNVFIRVGGRVWDNTNGD